MEENEDIHQTIVGRRIIKSNIHLSLSKQYSVHSFLHLTSSIDRPFQLKDKNHFIQPEIRQRIETLQRAARTRTQ